MRKRWFAAMALLGGIWWSQRSPADEHDPAPAAAVLADGFAIMTQRPHEPHRVIEVSRTGETRHQVTLHRDGDVRFAGNVVGWQDKTKVVLGVIDDDGGIEQVTTWGKKARQLCAGVATNEHRFGVGWLESNGAVWFVHGPVASSASGVTAAFDTAARASWCGIASAGENIALLWREGSRLVMNFCSSTQCGRLVVRVPIHAKDELLGYGCVRDACLFATRDPKGGSRIYRVTESGKTIVKPLEDAAASGPISIVGAGDRAFAIAYATENGTVVKRITLDGAPTEIRRYVDSRWPINLAWAAGRLLVTRPDHEVETFALPR